MPNLLRPFLDRCARGFTPLQKVGITVFIVVYVLSPLDLLPGLPIDDLGALYALFKVLTSPTVRHRAPDQPAAAQLDGPRV
jgi:uncharacterized membrane protein YkvA (DUF1232 family)